MTVPGACVCVFVCVCIPTLSLSSVFWDVREAMEMVSGWLLASPWLSSSSPSLEADNIITVTPLLSLLIINKLSLELLVIE